MLVSIENNKILFNRTNLIDLNKPYRTTNFHIKEAQKNKSINNSRRYTWITNHRKYILHKSYNYPYHWIYTTNYRIAASIRGNVLHNVLHSLHEHESEDVILNNVVKNLLTSFDFHAVITDTLCRQFIKDLPVLYSNLHLTSVPEALSTLYPETLLNIKTPLDIFDYSVYKYLSLREHTTFDAGDLHHYAHVLLLVATNHHYVRWLYEHLRLHAAQVLPVVLFMLPTDD